MLQALGNRSHAPRSALSDLGKAVPNESHIGTPYTMHLVGYTDDVEALVAARTIKQAQLTLGMVMWYVSR